MNRSQRPSHASLIMFVAACLMVATSVLAQNVSGKWALIVETDHGKAAPTISLRQSENRLTGTYSGRLGDAPLEGTMKGSEIKFSVKLKIRDQEFIVTYTGEVQGETMKGTVRFGESATGKWSARRQS